MVVTIDRPVGHERDADSEILMIAEVAHSLRMPKSIIYKLVRAGQLSGQKSGSRGGLFARTPGF
jgi:hypothetical protein